MAAPAPLSLCRIISLIMLYLTIIFLNVSEASSCFSNPFAAVRGRCLRICIPFPLNFLFGRSRKLSGRSLASVGAIKEVVCIILFFTSLFSVSGHKPEIILCVFLGSGSAVSRLKQRPLFRVAAVGFVGSFPSRRGCCRRVPVRSVLCHGQCSAGSDHRQQFLFGDEAYAQFGRLLEFGRSDLFSCDQKIDVGRYRREVFTAVRFDQFLQFVAAVTCLLYTSDAADE